MFLGAGRARGSYCGAMTDDAHATPARLRTTLDAVPGYKPGKPADAGTDETVYKISSNENPYPPLPSVLGAVRDAAATMNRYPDMASSELTQALAARLGVSDDEVSFGTGSVGVLASLIAITCEPGDDVVYAWRSFEAYPIVTALAGATSVQVPLDADARHDLDAMAGAVTERTRLLIVCTPNNPTGPSVRADELRAFLEKLPRDLLVVIDEAYLEFVEDAGAPDALAFYREFANVVVLRTFSKAYGLAGLRVGYAVARPRITEALRKAATPFGVSDMAQKAAIASLAAFDELDERVQALVAERRRVVEALADVDLAIPDTQANFIWLPWGERTEEFADAAKAAGLVVRPFAGEGVRCTIAEVAANDRLIDVVKAFRRGLTTAS